MISNWLQRYRLRRTSSKHLHVPKEVLDDLMSGEVEADYRLQEAQIEFVVVYVDGKTAQEISQRMGEVCALAQQHNGVIDTLISGLIVIVYGIPNLKLEGKGSRSTLCQTLQNHFGNKIKTVHGSGAGHFGIIGGDSHGSWSFIIPNLLDALTALSNLKFGEIKEIRE